MTVDFSKPVLFDAPNNGYMVSMKELPQLGVPNYEILEGYPNWLDVQAWLAAGNQAQPYVPPPTPPPDPVMQANATLQEIMLQYVNSVMVGPSAPLTRAAAWLAAWKASGRT